jgi:cellulose synthase (UDP-forming)
VKSPQPFALPPDTIRSGAYTERTGPLRAPRHPHQRVQYQRILRPGQKFVLGVFILINAAISVYFVYWLLRPEHKVELSDNDVDNITATAVFAIIMILEGMRLIQNFRLWKFAWLARDPVPMVPVKGMRVAFVTTIVPSKEPLDVAAKTLQAMRKVRHDGKLDVWILDEGDDPAVRWVAAKLGVRHFSRKGVARFNTKKGTYRTKSKNGNLNAWRALHEHEYDVVCSVDPDHVPLPTFVERVLGYFRDPDVGFVVSPQVYGNQQRRLTRAAEAQAFVFQGILQRSSNWIGTPMLVGTNYAYNVKAWQSIGGHQDSITEDLFTSMVLHATKNPETGNRWRSVYTPDVLAIGEGPASWTDYLNQQKRWSWGAGEIVMKHGWHLYPKLFFVNPRLAIYYMALELYYPTVSINWILANVLTGLYMFFGSDSIQTPIPLWGALWVNTIALQLGLLLWLRRMDISPYRKPGSSGFDGFVLSAVCAPIYAASFFGALLFRKLNFVVTAKGDLTSPDSWKTFGKHIKWGLFGAVAFTAGFFFLREGSEHFFRWVPPLFTVVISTGPIIGWWIYAFSDKSRRRKTKRRPAVSAPIELKSLSERVA